MAGHQVQTLLPFYFVNYFNSLPFDPLYSVLALNTAARVILIKYNVDHATPLLKTLQRLPGSRVIKAKALSRAELGEGREAHTTQHLRRC